MIRGRRRSRLRARCAGLLSELNLGPVAGRATTVDLQVRLQAYRRRPVHLIPVAVEQNGPTGMWVATGSADYIFHVSPQQTSPVHAFHCALHEAGHMLLEHSGSPSLAQHVRTLCDSLSAGPTSPVMLRTDYDDDLEQEAEVFATLGSGLIGCVREAAAACLSDDDRQLYDRLSEAFADVSTGPGGGR